MAASSLRSNLRKGTLIVRHNTTLIRPPRPVDLRFARNATEIVKGLIAPEIRQRALPEQIEEVADWTKDRNAAGYDLRQPLRERQRRPEYRYGVSDGDFASFMGAYTGDAVSEALPADPATIRENSDFTTPTAPDAVDGQSMRSKLAFMADQGAFASHETETGMAERQIPSASRRGPLRTRNPPLTTLPPPEVFGIPPTADELREISAKREELSPAFSDDEWELLEKTDPLLSLPTRRPRDDYEEDPAWEHELIVAGELSPDWYEDQEEQRETRQRERERAEAKRLEQRATEQDRCRRCDEPAVLNGACAIHLCENCHENPWHAKRLCKPCHEYSRTPSLEASPSMTGIDVKYEAERWELLSRCASLCAEEASRVAQSLAQAQPREDGRWLVPPGTHRDARRAMSSAAVLFKVARELDYREPYTTDKG
jgi:hypothetical protein